MATKLVKVSEKLHEFIVSQGKFGETMGQILERMLKAQIKKWEKSKDG